MCNQSMNEYKPVMLSNEEWQGTRERAAAIIINEWTTSGSDGKKKKKES